MNVDTRERFAFGHPNWPKIMKHGAHTSDPSLRCRFIEALLALYTHPTISAHMIGEPDEGTWWSTKEEAPLVIPASLLRSLTCERFRVERIVSFERCEELQWWSNLLAQTDWRAGFAYLGVTIPTAVLTPPTVSWSKSVLKALVGRLPQAGLAWEGCVVIAVEDPRLPEFGTDLATWKKWALTPLTEEAVRAHKWWVVDANRIHLD